MLLSHLDESLIINTNILLLRYFLMFLIYASQVGVLFPHCRLSASGRHFPIFSNEGIRSANLGLALLSLEGSGITSLGIWGPIHEQPIASNIVADILHGFGFLTRRAVLVPCTSQHTKEIVIGPRLVAKGLSRCIGPPIGVVLHRR